MANCSLAVGSRNQKVTQPRNAAVSSWLVRGVVEHQVVAIGGALHCEEVEARASWLAC